MKSKYAVFDWDNTVRQYFTLFDWIDYLIEKKVLNKDIELNIAKITKRYQDKEITHDEYAKLACCEYAKSIQGLEVLTLQSIAKKYVSEKDCKRTFLGMQTIFDFLHSRNIDIIIISGAPTIILNLYTDIFHIAKIYAFRPRTKNGLYDGSVAYNYGYDKQKILKRVENQYDCKPIAAFGDSSSDIPLINAAEIAFSMNSDLEGATRINIENQIIDPNSLTLIKDSIISLSE